MSRIEGGLSVQEVVAGMKYANCQQENSPTEGNLERVGAVVWTGYASVWYRTRGLDSRSPETARVAI